MLFGHQGEVKSIKREASYTVSELNIAIRELLESTFFYCIVEGEISNIAMPQSGHVYFTLKDENAAIRVVLWRNQAAQYLHLLKSGAKVALKGKVSAYPARGEYQFIATSVEPQGEGDLFARYHALKEQLLKEGIFDPQRKKKIPRNPQKIGIITSQTAAALQDVLNVLKEHRPDIPLILYPTLVQGEQAKEEIVAAIKRANFDGECDLLLLIRGGGSIEDLWPFNEEVVARAIAASRLPLITGIGHETDTTIADFVADFRAATPSVAAKSAGISRDYLLQYLDHQQIKLIQAITHKIEQKHRVLEALNGRLLRQSPQLKLELQQEYLKQLQSRLMHGMALKIEGARHTLSLGVNMLDKRLIEDLLVAKRREVEELSSRLQLAMAHVIERRKHHFKELLLALDALSPLKVLTRGYAVLLQGGRQIQGVADLDYTQEVEIRLKDGVVKASLIEEENER